MGVGITFGTVAAIGIVMACLLCRSEWKDASRTTAQFAQKMLFIEFCDWILDWITFTLAFHEADLRFHNDPHDILRSLLLTLCALSTVSWFFEIILFCTSREKFLRHQRKFNFAHILLEDGSQVVLYAIAAGGNASQGADDSTIQVILVVIAALQSLIFFLLKAHELFNPSGVAVLRS